MGIGIVRGASAESEPSRAYPTPQHLLASRDTDRRIVWRHLFIVGGSTSNWLYGCSALLSLIDPTVEGSDDDARRWKGLGMT